MRKNHHIVDRGHRVAAHPFEDRLRRVEAASDLHIGNLEPFVFDQRLDVCAGRRHVDRRRIGRHKNTTFLTEYKKPSACFRYCTQTALFYQKMVHNETQSILTLSGKLNKHLYVLRAAQRHHFLAEENSRTAGIQN